MSLKLLVRGGAVVVALVLLCGMFFEGSIRALLHIGAANRSIRETCTLLWAFLFPAWWQLEDILFAPREDPQLLKQFYEGQQKARYAWLLLAGSVAIIIGNTPSQLPDETSSEKSKKHPQEIYNNAVGEPSGGPVVSTTAP